MQDMAVMMRCSALGRRLVNRISPVILALNNWKTICDEVLQAKEIEFIKVTKQARGEILWDIS